MKLLATFLTASFSFLTAANSSERIGNFTIFPDHNMALLNGPITLETDRDFDEVLSRLPSLYLLGLNSPGGTVTTALNISNKIHTLGIDTIVPSTGSCASACSTIFLSGKSRQAIGQLGVHQMSTRGEQDIAVVQNLVSNILDLYEKIGVDGRITRYMLTTPPNDMYFFSDIEKDAFSINRKYALKPLNIETPNPIKHTFSDYLPKTYLKGKPILPNFKTDKGSNSYRTRIRDGMKDGPNFAGHYNIILIGCGTSCKWAMLIDATTGKSYDFPIGGEENYQMHLTMTVDSRLLKATWRDALDDTLCIKQDYEMIEQIGLKLINEVRYTIPETAYCEEY